MSCKRETHTHTDRQRERETERQTDRQTNRQTDREKREKEMKVYHFSKLCRYIIHQQYDQFSYNVLA